MIRSAEPAISEPDRRAEALGQAHRDGVEQPPVVLGADVPVATCAFHSRAPSRCSAHRRARRPRSRSASSSVEGLDGAAAEVVGVLHRDHAGGDQVRAALGDGHADHVGRGEQAVGGVPGPGGHRAEGGVRAELGADDVRGGVAEHLLAGRASRRRPSWLAIEPVGVNSAASWPSSRGDPLLQREHRRVLAVDVVPDLGVGHRRAHAGVGRVTVSLRRSITQWSQPLEMISWSLSGLAVHLGDLEGEVEGLRAVQARVAGGLVALVEVGLVEDVAAADALGDVVAGELHVDAARVGAQRAVHLEEAADLVEHVVEAAGLVAARRPRRCCRASGRRPSRRWRRRR